MTAIELRTTIAADLDLLSVEMLESVSHYVKRLRSHSRLGRRMASAPHVDRHSAVLSDSAMEITPRVQRFMRGNPWHASDDEVEQLRREYLEEKYQ